MISSNINEILLKNDLQEASKTTSSSTEFLSSLLASSKKENDVDVIRDDSLTFDNIKGISLEEIDTLFKDEDSKNMAENLRLATLFTEDDTLGQALFIHQFLIF